MRIVMVKVGGVEANCDGGGEGINGNCDDEGKGIEATSEDNSNKAEIVFTNAGG